MSRLISFVALIAIIIVIGLLFYNVMAGFFVPVFLAAVLVVVFHPLHRWVLEKTGQREKLAATLTTLLIMICVLLPLGTVITAASVQGLRLLKEVLPPAEDGAQSNTTSVRLRIGLNLDRMRDFFGLHMDHEEFLRNAQRDLDRILREADQAPTSDPTPEIKRLGKVAAQTFAEFKAEVRLSGMALLVGRLPTQPHIRGSSTGEGLGLMLEGGPRFPERSLSPAAAETIAHLGKNLHPSATGARDFEDTAEIIRGLEGVISVDTSVAHLAASMGKPTWILLPHDADWRWGGRQRESIWYPSAHLIRQSDPGDWGAPIRELNRSLGAQ